MSRKIVELLLTGKSQNEICRLTRRGKRKVARIRAMAENAGYLSGTRLPPYPEAALPESPDGRMKKRAPIDNLLLPHKDWIVQKLADGWLPITLFEELPVKVERSGFYRFLYRHNLSPTKMTRRVIPEIVHTPGEALIVDWGLLRTVLDPATGTKRKLWAFVGVLGYSRFMMVRLVWRMDTQTTIQTIESMLQEIGGVPRKITSDNPKCFALVADRYEPLLNPAYERFVSHYDTIAECLPPKAPEKKGKVERLIPYVRRLYQAHSERWLGIEESQQYLDQKIIHANERCHGTTARKPIEVFLDVEAPKLKPLPAAAYMVEEYHEGRVRKDGCVRFRGKYYSLEESFIGKDVIVLASSEIVSIYCAGKLQETHSRIKDPMIAKSVKTHHLKPWERSMMETSVYRDRAQKLGCYVDQIVTQILLDGAGVIDFRKVWGILSLDKTHTSEGINEACRLAIAEGNPTYRAVKRYLRLGLKPDRPLGDVFEALPLTSQDEIVREQTNQFVRSVCEYREMILIKGAKKDYVEGNSEKPIN